MFPPRYHGTTFTVTYSFDPSQKGATRSHLITSRDSCDLISLDWKGSLLSIPAADVVSVESKKGLAVLTLRPPSKQGAVYLNTKPDPIEPLISALTTIVALPRAEPKILAVGPILASFQITDKQPAAQFQKGMQGQNAQFIQAFCPSAGSIAVNPAFVDAFACSFRMRYRNDAALPINQTVPALGLDVRRQLIVAWCEGIKNCLEPVGGLIGKQFYGRLALNAANTIKKAAKPLTGLGVDEVVEAAQAFLAKGAREGLEAAVTKLQKDVQDEIESGLQKVEPFDRENLTLLLNLVITVLSGIAVGMYSVDVEALSAKVVDFTQAVIGNNKVAEARNELLQTQSVFLKDLAVLLDGQRYDEPFQFIFCTWSLKGSE
jgi:hypothetical protein